MDGKLCYAEFMAVLSVGMVMQGKVEYLHHETVYVSARACNVSKYNVDAR